MAAGGHRQPFSSAVFAKLRTAATKFIPQGFAVRHSGDPQVILSNALLRGWGGTLDPNPVVTLTSNGSVWTLTLTGTGTVNLRCNFEGVEHIFDTTPAASINLTEGTDTAPKRNFVYLTESGGVVTLNANTTGFPVDTAQIHIAEAFLQSAASGQAQGPRQSQQWSDHIDDGFSGGLDHVREKVRHLGASWESGVAPGDMVVSAPDAYLSVGSGVVYQLHMHDFPALDMQSGDVFFVVNDPTTPNKAITSLDDITQLADGGAINNRHFPLVMWASQNINDTGQVYINLPTGSYATAAKAELDANKYAVFSIPTAYSGTAFLVAEYFVQGKDSGTWVQSKKVSLREPGAFSPGGAAAITTHTDMDGLTSGDAGHTQFPLRTEWNANSVLVAVSDDTPVVQAVADSEFVGRPAGGNVGVMTAAQAEAVLTNLLLLNGSRAMTGALTASGIVRNTTAQAYVAGVLGFTDSNFGFLFRPPRVGADGAHLFEAFDGTDLLKITEAGAITILGNTVWNAGNDGTGSGLDADKMKGATMKFDATAAPGVNDDVTGGYGPGSMWVDVTNDDAYICLDGTDTAAVWKKITP